MLLSPPKNTLLSWSLLHKSFYQFAKLIIPCIIRTYFQFEVNGIEHIERLPEGTPVIYCFNHRSHLDSFLFASAIVYPFGNRTMCGLMASGKAMQEGMLGLLKYLGAFPVYPQNPAPALDYAARLLKENIAVLIAPQGKRIPSNPLHDYHNFIQETKSGVGRLILRFNGKIPVVPMYIHGSLEAFAHGKIIPKFKSFMSVSFCKPLSFTKFTRKEGWSDSDSSFYSTAHKISKQIMSSIKTEMLIQEKYFFEIIKRKFNTPLDKLGKLDISSNSHLKTKRFFSKLLQYHPDELKKWIEGTT